MADVYTHQENAGLSVSSVKMRHQRLHSAPDVFLAKKDLKSPRPRKALQVMSINASTAVVQEKKHDVKVKTPQTAVEDYPDVEAFHPYDPRDFLKYDVPEDMVFLGDLPLAGLAARLSDHLDEEPLVIEPEPSPLKVPSYSDMDSELQDFLLTLDELTLDPEPVTEY